MIWCTFTEYKLVQSNERGFVEKVPQLTVKGVGLVVTSVCMLVCMSILMVTTEYIYVHNYVVVI